MKSMRSTTIAAVAGVLLVAAIGGLALNAQQAPAVKRTILTKQDMTIQGREAVMAVVDLPPGSAEGRHTHPAEVFAFVLEGPLTLEVEGQPNVTLKAGDYFTLAPGQIHQVVNGGSAPGKLVAVFVTEKGKPLTTQVK